MKSVRFSDGVEVAALGQGSWMMAERRKRYKDEIAALRVGVELGMALIDTAEMYADGGSERLVGQAIIGIRDQVFLVSKAYPQNASLQRLPLACEDTLERLGTDRLDLYLLHWRGGVPLTETVEAMQRLVDAGKILRWGVSNLDVKDMEALVAAGGEACATDQILYNLTRRGPELDILPWLANRRMPVMAYCPIEQGRLVEHPDLAAIAGDVNATSAQVALAWLLARDGVIAIPKAGSVDHVRENRKAADLVLSAETLTRLDALFPAPTHPVPLEII